MAEAYRKRFWRRFRKDATAWARDNIVWAVIVLVVPPIAVWLRDPNHAIDWSVIRAGLCLYGVALLVYILVHVSLVPKKLDSEREINEQALIDKIAERNATITATINDYEKTIKALSTKPKRSSAEQHRYDTAKKSFQKLDAIGITVLRHLRTHGKLTYASGIGNVSPLPTGLAYENVIAVLNQCTNDGLITVQHDSGIHAARTWSIPETMAGILDELLYPTSGG